MSAFSLGRRALLRSFGHGAAAAGLFPHFERIAGAATMGTAKRLLILNTPNATLKPFWLPRGMGGVGAPTETAFDLGPMMAPLEAFKKQMLILGGLDNVIADLDWTAASDSHVRVQCHILTGMMRQGPSSAGGPSIDQVIAKQLNSPLPITRFPSLELYVSRQPCCDYVGSTFWQAAGRLMPQESNPQTGYNRVFGNFMPPGSGSISEETRKLALRRQSVLDVVKGEFGAMSPRLPQNSRDKFDAHAQAVRDLETRLSAAPTTGGASCIKPSGTDFKSISDNMSQEERFTLTGDLMPRLAVAAMACDLTRVVSIQFENVPNGISGHNGGDIHVDLIHRFGGYSTAAQQMADPNFKVMQTFYLWYAKSVANTLNMLKQIPEGAPGETMLDHTLVLWLSDFGGGSHDVHDYPFVLAGGAGGYFRMGRYLTYPRRAAKREERFTGDTNDKSFDRDVGGSTEGLPQNNLLVSIANAMGVPITTFGDSRTCTGPLDNLR